MKKVETLAYIETLKRVRECRRDIRRVFEEVDVLLLPTMREPAPLISETVNETHRPAAQQYLGVQPFRHPGDDAAVRFLEGRPAHRPADRSQTVGRTRSAGRSQSLSETPPPGISPPRDCRLGGAGAIACQVATS